MRTNEPYPDPVARRLASLPPAKRELFERLARTAASAGPSAKATPEPKADSHAMAQARSDSTHVELEQEHSSVIPKGFVQWGGAAPLDDQKDRVRQFYDVINGQLTAAAHGEHAMFLTFGYATTNPPDDSRVTLPKHCLNKHCIQLVCELVGDCSLEGRRVLDVGCGRGGTIHVLHRYFSPASAVGLDLSAEAIVFCRQTHAGLKATFVHGDAEHLPFDDGEFDVITNVESSHSYPDLDQFYREVHRVLAAGGCFLYTDLLSAGRWTQSLAYLESLGLEVERARDITENALRACALTGPTHLQAFQAGNDSEIMGNFLGLDGSSVYEGMKQGRTSYRIYRFRKAPRSNSVPL